MRRLMVLGIGLFLGVGILIFASSVTAQSGGNWWGALQFAADNNSLKFFDAARGKVYVYSQVDGRYIQTLTLQELGQDMQVEYRVRDRQESPTGMLIR